MSQVFINNGRAFLVEDQGDTLVVEDGVNIPDLGEREFFTATLFQEFGRYGHSIEVVKVTSVEEGLWRVERGQEGTNQRTHPIGTPIELRLTAGTMENHARKLKKIKIHQLIGL